MRFAKRLAYLCAMVTAGAVLLGASQVLVTTYSDGEFIDVPNGPWVYFVAQNPDPDSCITVIDGGRVTSGGNPGAYRTALIDFCPGKTKKEAAVFAINTDATYLPGSGATPFQHVDAELEARICNDNVNQPNIYVLALQDGHYYISEALLAEYAVPNCSTLWVPWSVSTQVANSFVEIDPVTLAVNWSSHPNFINGPIISFGYLIYGLRSPAPPFEGQVDVDNWSVSIHEQ